MRVIAALVAALLLTAAVGCGDEEPEPAPVPEAVEPEPEPGELDFDRVETVAEGLEVPWSLAFPDEETILVTERPGTVRAIEDGALRGEPVARIDVTHEGEGGLLGVALHPDFPDPRAGYLYYTLEGENRISRFDVGPDFNFTGEEVLASAPAATIHNGGHIAFGPDGLLHASTGDAGEPPLSADPDSLAGKILRFEPDGTPAGADAFDGSPALSYGHRNPQGFDWTEDQRLYAAEHGPTGEFGLCCHDEVNLISEGRFYGWPFIAGGEVPAQGGEPPADPVPPIAASGGGDTWAPGGLAVHEPAGGPVSLLVANLAAERMMRLEVPDGGPRQVAETEIVIDGLGRLRAAVTGPDGCLYFTTSNTDGRGSPRDGDDRVARVCEQG